MDPVALLGEAKATIDKLQQDLRSCASARLDAEAAAAAATADVSILRARVRDLHLELESARQDAAAARAALMDATQARSTSVRLLEDELGALRSRAAAATAQAAQATQSAEAAHARANQLQSEVSGLQQLLNDRSAALAQAQEAARQARSESMHALEAPSRSAAVDVALQRTTSLVDKLRRELQSSMSAQHAAENEQRLAHSRITELSVLNAALAEERDAAVHELAQVRDSSRRRITELRSTMLSWAALVRSKFQPIAGPASQRGTEDTFGAVGALLDALPSVHAWFSSSASTIERRAADGVQSLETKLAALTTRLQNCEAVQRSTLASTSAVAREREHALAIQHARLSDVDAELRFALEEASQLREQNALLQREVEIVRAQDEASRTSLADMRREVQQLRGALEAATATAAEASAAKEAAIASSQDVREAVGQRDAQLKGYLRLLEEQIASSQSVAARREADMRAEIDALKEQLTLAQDVSIPRELRAQLQVLVDKVDGMYVDAEQLGRAAASGRSSQLQDTTRPGEDAAAHDAVMVQLQAIANRQQQLSAQLRDVLAGTLAYAVQQARWQSSVRDGDVHASLGASVRAPVAHATTATKLSQEASAMTRGASTVPRMPQADGTWAHSRFSDAGAPLRDTALRDVAPRTAPLAEPRAETRTAPAQEPVRANGVADPDFEHLMQRLLKVAQ